MPIAFRLFCTLALATLLPVSPALAQSRLVDEVLLKPSTVHSVAELPDGGFVIASDTTHLGSTPVGSSLLRFDADLVPQLNWGPAIDDARGLAFDSAAQRLYVGGSFDSVGTTARPRLARLGLDGQLDDWAAVAQDGQQTARGAFEQLAVLPGGDLLAVHRPDSRERRELLRVSAVSGRYSVIHRLDGAVFDLQLLGDGSVLVGGAFEFVNASLRRGLIKLTAGTLAVDTAFAARPTFPGRWSWYQVTDIALDSAGVVHVTGGVIVYRLRADGSSESSLSTDFGGDGRAIEQIAFDAQDRLHVLSGWSFSPGVALPATNSGLLRLTTLSGAGDPTFEPPAIIGRGARLRLQGERLMLLGSVRSRELSARGVAVLAAASGAPLQGPDSFGTSQQVRLYGAVPAPEGGALVFGEFTHTPDATLWGTLRLNAQGQRLAGPFMDFVGTPDSFALRPSGELLYTSQVTPMPRPQDWGAQVPEASWHVGRVLLADGSRLPGDPGAQTNANVLKSGVASYGSGMIVAERDLLRTGNSVPELPYASTRLPYGTSRKVAVGADGLVLIDRGPPPPNAFSGLGGIGFWPPPPSPSSPVYLLYRWLPGPAAAVGLGLARTAPHTELGGFDVDTATGFVYASFPGQTSAQPAWSIRRIDPLGPAEGEVLGSLEGIWASGGLALDLAGAYLYAGGYGADDFSGDWQPRVFRVSTVDGAIDSEWPFSGSAALSPRWMFMFGDQVFALAATATGTYAAFYRTDDVLFEDSFER